MLAFMPLIVNIIFVLDLDSLDDEKLTKVREFVKQHSKNTDVLSHGSSSESCSPTQKKLTKVDNQFFTPLFALTL